MARLFRSARFCVPRVDIDALPENVSDLEPEILTNLRAFYAGLGVEGDLALAFAQLVLDAAREDGQQGLLAELAAQHQERCDQQAAARRAETRQLAALKAADTRRHRAL